MLFQRIQKLFNNRLPGQLVVQLTDQCNATCPQCGMRRSEKFPHSTLELDEVKSIIDSAAANGVEAISFTGGEPFLYLDQVIELARHAGAAGIPYIRTGTNGFMFARFLGTRSADKIHKMVEQLACTPIRNIWFSLDSAIPEVHDEMRGFSGLDHGMEKALPIFHDHGINPSANLGINRRIGGASTASHFAVVSRPSTRFY